MIDKYIQSYTLEDIIKTSPDKIVSKSMTIVDVNAQQPNYLRIHRPYKFATLGIILITKGSCEITVNLEQHHIKKDDIIVVLPSHVFEILSFTDDFAVKATFISSEFVIDAGFHLKSHNLIQFMSSSYPKIIGLDRQTVRTIRYHLGRIRQYIVENDNIFSQEIILHHFSILMYEMGSFYNRMVLAKTTGSTVRKEEMAKQFLFLVATYFKKQRNVQFYADQLFVSRKHLTKMMTDVFNKSPKQIIAEAIILEAKVMLKNPNISVSQVMNELNFSDSSVFSKFFKNYTNLSPSAYKANN